jgi:hypothetical protein
MSREERLIDLTQSTRERMIEDLTKDGLPDNNKDRRVLMELMADADSTSLAFMRLESETDDEAVNRRAAQMAVALTKELGDSNPFEGAVSKAPATPTSLPAGADNDLELEEGELDIGISDLTYDEFTEED